MSLLFPAPVAPPIEGIDLRCCGVDEVLREVRGARLIMADPPWRYTRDMGGANPEMNGIYAGLSESEIAAHLDASYDCAAKDARLLVWYTWPKDEEWRDAGQAGPRWGKRVTGGAWNKEPGPNGSGGVGYHWRGRSEPVAVFVRGAPGRPSCDLKNSHHGAMTDHSEKPLDWLRAIVRAWTEPGDLVLDLYAGLAPLARACLLEGRRYVGAEIDPERHAQAMGRLHRCQ